MNAKQTKGFNEKSSVWQNIHTLVLVQYDGSKGEWINNVIDRVHFRRRIQQTEMILLPIMNKIIKLSKGKWT